MKNKEILLNISEKIDGIADSLRDKPKVGFDTEAMLNLTRHQIGSVNLQDLIDTDLLIGDKRKVYLQQAEAIWNNPVFLNEIHLIIRKQLEFIGMQADYFEKTILGRGTINGADLLKERFERFHVEYKDSTKKPEDFDKFAISV